MPNFFKKIGREVGRGAKSLFPRSGKTHDAIFGTKPQQKFQPFYQPEQESILDQLLSQGMEEFQGQPLEDMATKEFQESIIPSLAERFTSMGGEGGQRSSAFQGALGRAGSDLSSRLASMRSQMGMQKLNLGLGQRGQPYVQPGQQGFLGSLTGMGGGGEGGSNMAPLIRLLASLFV